MSSVQKSVGGLFKSGWRTLMQNKILIVLGIVFGLLSESASVTEEVSGGLGLILLVLGLIGFIGTIGVHGAIHITHMNRLTNTTVNVTSRVFSRLLSLIGIFILYIISVVIGLLLFIIPGIYVGLKLYPSFAICVMEDKGVINSINTSWNYTSGNLLTILGLFIVLVTLQIASIVLAALIAIPSLFAGSFGVLPAGVVGLVAILLLAILELTIEGSIADFVLEAQDISDHVSNNNTDTTNDTPDEYSVEF